MRLLIAILMISFGTLTATGQKTLSYNADALKKRVTNADTIYIVNFWATWCIPCVKELPEFNTIYEQYKSEPVKVLMVSLDFKESYPKKLESFIDKKKLKPEVVWFNETNANEFIPKIDDSWSGSIPATWIVNTKNGFQKFNEGIITAAQVSSIVDRQLDTEN